MGLQQNLTMGGLAVGYVRRLGIRSNDQPGWEKMPQKEWDELGRCIGDGPESVRGKFMAFCRTLDPASCLQGPGGVDRLAELAAKSRCGNCTEQDAMAIIYLRNRGVSPLDLMLLNTYNNVDHSFVVIGRLPNLTDPDWVALPQSHVNGSTDTDPATWGPDAVICDPWHNGGKVYPARDIEKEMFRGYNNYRGILQPASIWRVE